MKKLCLLTALALGIGSAHSQTVPTAGTIISNQGFVSGLDATGQPISAVSDQVDVMVTLVASIQIGPDGDATTPGQSVSGARNTNVTLTYTVTNTGNGDQTAILEASHSDNAPAQLYLDDGNGTFGNEDTDLGLSANQFLMTAGTNYRVFMVTTSGPNGAVVNLSGTTIEGAPTDSNNIGEINVVESTRLQWSAVSPAQIVASPSTVSVNVRLESSSGVPLENNLKLDVIIPANVTASYRVANEAGGIGDPATTLQEALSNYNGGGDEYPIRDIQPLIIQATFNVPAGYSNGDMINPEFLAWVDPQTEITSDQTASDPARIQSEITVGEVLGTVRKQQMVCVAGTSDFNCGTFTESSVTAKPCDLIYYRISAFNRGLFPVNSAIVSDEISNEVKLYFSLIQGFEVRNDTMGTDEFPSVADTSQNVNVRTSEPSTPWTPNFAEYAGLENATLQGAALVAGEPGPLNPARGLYMLAMGQIKGNGCLTPDRSTNIIGGPGPLDTAER